MNKKIIFSLLFIFCTNLLAQELVSCENLITNQSIQTDLEKSAINAAKLINDITEEIKSNKSYIIEGVDYLQLLTVAELINRSILETTSLSNLYSYHTLIKDNIYISQSRKYAIGAVGSILNSLALVELNLSKFSPKYEDYKTYALIMRAKSLMSVYQLTYGACKA